MGPKKKGGKANKLARMTDEQRERYLQHRAAIEEETRRRKEQLIATFMRNKLKREEAFTRINSAKINQHWRHILRKIKCAELKDDVQNLWLSFERLMDQKQKQKDELLSSLEVSERQYSDTLQSHMEVVERLIEIHSNHVDFLKALFNAQLIEHLSSSTDEKAFIHAMFERENQRLRVIRMAMELDLESSERKLYKSEKVNKISEIKRKFKDDWECLVSERGRALEEIWLQIQECLNSYASDTATKRKTVQRLQKMDQDWLKTLADIQRSSKRVGLMKVQVDNKINEISENNANFKKERDSLIHCHKILVQRVGKEKRKDDEKFQHLVITSNKALQDLNKVRTKGEKALAMLVLCQRFESKVELQASQKPIVTHKSTAELEEVQCKSFKNESVGWDGIFHDDDDDDDESFLDLEEKEMRTYGKLTNFWKKYNKVLIETTNVRMEKDLLALENRKLRTTLQSYLSEMACVDSCGAPSGHRIVSARARPRTSPLYSLKGSVRIAQRPVSSISWVPSLTSCAVSPGSRHSGSQASSCIAKTTAHAGRLSDGSSNSDQWSI